MGCAHFREKKTKTDKKEFAIKPVDQIVGPGDSLKVSSFNEKIPSGVFVVSKEGYILFPFIGKIKVGGLKLDDVNTLIIAKLRDGYFREPMLSVTFAAHISQKITVMGKVKQSVSFAYIPKTTILVALSAAGGIDKGADREALIIVRTYKGRSYRIKVNLKDIIDGKVPNFYLLPGDIVIVPEKFI